MRLALVSVGIGMSAVLLEFILQAGHVFISRYQSAKRLPGAKPVILFAGDSWTYGCDAEPGKGFVALLQKDVDLASCLIVNLGYGGNNGFQTANSLIEYGAIPRAVFITVGINAWHFIGIHEFYRNALPFLNANERRDFTREFTLRQVAAWYEHLRIYKLVRLVFPDRSFTRQAITLKQLDDRFGTRAFWDAFMHVRTTYPESGVLEAAMPQALQSLTQLSLDQKFYFTALHYGFDTVRMKKSLEQAGCFSPEKLTDIPYSWYESMDVHKQGMGDKRERMLFWVLTVVQRWAYQRHVAVFIQLYPDIKKEDLVERDRFAYVNSLLLSSARRLGLGIVDHNAYGIDWTQCRTTWHVNNEGHGYMKDTIKKRLLEFLADRQ